MNIFSYLYRQIFQKKSTKIDSAGIIINSTKKIKSMKRLVLIISIIMLSINVFSQMTKENTQAAVYPGFAVNMLSPIKKLEFNKGEIMIGIHKDNGAVGYFMILKSPKIDATVMAVYTETTAVGKKYFGSMQDENGNEHTCSILMERGFEHFLNKTNVSDERMFFPTKDRITIVWKRSRDNQTFVWEIFPLKDVSWFQ